MPIVYTRHARQRMASGDRDVTEADVEATLGDPDILRPGRQGAQTANKTIGGRRVSVVYRRRGDEIIVITVTVS